jgi:hypothetical protein
MNWNSYSASILLALITAAQAEPLNPKQIAPDAKWLVHIDGDNLRQSQAGKFLINQLLLPKAAQLTGALKLNPTNILDHISSITAYGTEFKAAAQGQGVLLINSDPDTRKALEGVLVAQLLANTNGPVKKLSGQGEPALYSFGNEIFIAPQKDGPIIISKSQDQIEAARDLIGGKGPSLATSKAFGDLLSISNSFFVVAAAQAFNQPDLIPAEAKVLRMADGGSVALGETGDQLALRISLRGKTAEVTQEIQQVIEGMVALVKLGQPDVPDLVALANSIKVASADQLVTVSAEYPEAKAMSRLQEMMTEKPKAHKAPHHKSHSKVKLAPESKPDQLAPKPEADEPSTPSK